MSVLLLTLFVFFAIIIPIIISRFRKCSVKDILTEPAIVIAARKNDLQEVERLIKKKVDVNAQGSHKITALHYAVDWQNLEMCRLLMVSYANPNLQNDYGNTPVHYAAMNNFKEITELFLQYDPDLTLKNIVGHTPLSIAEFYGCKDTLDLLRRKP